MLGTVHHLGIETLAVRAPGQVGDVPLFAEIPYIQPDSLGRCKAVHAHADVLRGHAVHGIVKELELAGAGLDVEERELAYAALVLLVEGHLGGVRAHVPSGIDAKLVAAYGFSVDDTGVCRLGDADGGVLLAVFGIQAALVCKEREPALARGRHVREFVARDTAIAYTPEDGFFHGEVFAGMGFPYVDDAVLCKKKSAGDKGACSDKHPFHRLLKEKVFF